MARDPYKFWDAMLAGEPADLERNEVVCGRFWKRLQSGDVIGISIDPLDGGNGFEVRVAKGSAFTLTTDAQIEDFCERTLSWICRQPVEHTAYAAWWTTGQWPEGALIDRKPSKPSRRKSAAAPVVPKADTHSEPVAQDVAPVAEALPGQPSAAPGIQIRAYASIDPCDEAEAYLAQAVTMKRVKPEKGGGWREGPSVFFRAESAEAAREKAQAWVAAEREREAGKAANIAAGRARRQSSLTDSAQTGASL